MFTHMMLFTAAVVVGWEARVENGRILGYVDHPEVVEMEGGSIHINDMKAVEEGRSRGEYLIKLKAPVAQGTLRRVEDVVRGDKGWVKHAARNTYIAHISNKAAGEIRKIARVKFVGVLKGEHIRHFKLHKSVTHREGFKPETLLVTLHSEDFVPYVTSLISTLDPFVKVTVDGRILTMVHMHKNDYKWDAVVGRLLHEEVHEGVVEMIEHPMEIKVLNKYSRPIMSTGNPTLGDEPYAYLDGAGAVVGLADTGIDADHCFFHDPANTIPYDRVNPSHRKIVSYKTSDSTPSGKGDTDSGGGHGTHIAGTIAGSVVNPSAHPDMVPYHGFVPSAKLSFVDLAGQFGSAESVQLPADIEKGIFQVNHDAGARIHSNSWGGGRSYYSTSAIKVDSFSLSNPEDLVVFSAGNEADKACEPDPSNPLCDKHTVMSPSVSKNSVSVGASFAPLASWQEMGLDNFLLSFNSMSYRITKGYFGERHPDLPVDTALIWAEPADGCAPDSNPSDGLLTNKDAMKGKLAIVNRGTCFFGVKVQEIQDSGAVGAIIVNNVPGDPIVMGLQDGDETDFKIPAFMISQTGGKMLRSALTAAPDLKGSIIVDPNPNPHKSMNNLAEFSSRGPTSDLRFKPDVVAVGYYVHSARSDSLLDTQNCDLAAEMGTSMACPMVAATGVQLRQWLQTTENKAAPTGILVKTLLVQSAVPLTGLVDRNAQGDWEHLGSTPSFYQGHGRVTLEAVVPREGSNVATLIREGSVGSGGSVTYCVEYATATKYGFRATLGWMDPVAGGNSKFMLVNDLDLRVKTPSGKVYLGNGIGAPSEHVRDALNNIEKVLIKDAEVGRYEITVEGFSFGDANDQSFALVASGAEASDCAALPSCTASSYCDVQTFTGELSETNHTLPVWGWRVYEYVSNGRTNSLKITVSRISQYDKHSDIDVYVRKGLPPTTNDYDTHYDTSQMRLFEDVKTLEYATVDDADQAKYYVGIHAGCCHTAVFDIRIAEASTPLPTEPVVTNIYVEDRGAVSGSPTVVLTEAETRNGATIVIQGSNLGKEEDFPTLSITYGADNIHLSCKADKWVSETEIHCRTTPMSYYIVSPLTIYIATYKINTAPHTLQFYLHREITGDNVIQGLYAHYCNSTQDACVPYESIYFNYYISVKGSGDIYIEGRSIGERWYGSETPTATVQVGKYDCNVMKYISDDMLHCRTDPGISPGIYALNVTMGPVVIKDAFKCLVIMEGPTRISGVSNSIPPTSKSRISLTYEEVFNAEFLPTVTLYGENLYEYMPSLCRAGVICGTSEIIEMPAPTLRITVGQYPLVEDGVCEAFDYSDSGDRMRCQLNITNIHPDLYYFKVRRYGFELITADTEATFDIMGEAQVSGLSYKGMAGDPSPSIQLPYAVVSDDSSSRHLYITGVNFGSSPEQRMAIYVLKHTSDGRTVRIGSCPSQLLNEKLIQLALPPLSDLSPRDGDTYEVTLQVGNTMIDNVHLTFTILPQPTLEGIGLSSDAAPVKSLEIPAGTEYLYVFGKHHVDPIVVYVTVANVYLCKAKKVTSDYIQCELTPESVGTDMELAISYGETPLRNNTMLSFAPITPSWNPAVVFQPQSLLTYIPFNLTLPGMPDVPVKMTTTVGCGFLGTTMDTGITIDVVQGKEATITDHMYFFICFQYKDFWYTADPSVLPVPGVDKVSLVSVTANALYWTAVYPLQGEGPHYLGVFPTEAKARLMVQGFQLPNTGVLKMGPTCDTGMTYEDGVLTGKAHIFIIDNPRMVMPDVVGDKFALCYQANGTDGAVMELGYMNALTCVTELQCGNRGVCDKGSCVCDEHWRGVHCETQCPMGRYIAPNGTALYSECSGAGFCGPYGQCTCYAEHYGEDCSLAAKPMDKNEPRAGVIAPFKNDLFVFNWNQPTDAVLYVTLSWFEPRDMYDLLIWDSPSSVGRPDKVKYHHVMAAPYPDTKKLIVEVTLSQTEYVFAGVYGTNPDKVEMHFQILLSDGLGAPVEETPAPLLDTARRYAKQYTVVAVVAGLALGILFVCLLAIIWKLVIKSIYMLHKARQPRVLDEADHGGGDDVPGQAHGEAYEMSTNEAHSEHEQERAEKPSPDGSPGMRPPPAPESDEG